ncbi:MAG: hypothetical protein LBB73_03230, partial [Dysgonamonadaceae bacterium]|nr:hypothetical protein [Dysgonamonadaceae bacterium]
MKKEFTYLIFFLFPALHSCLDTPDMTVGIVNTTNEPSVVSGNASYFADGALQFVGEVTVLGRTTDIFEKGFYWGFSADTLTDSVSLENVRLRGRFSYRLPNARGDATYYWKAFAKNDYGISLGEIKTLATPAIFENSGNFTGKVRSNFTAFALKNILYLTCGDNSGVIYADVWRYEGIWWNDIDNIPGEARRYPVAFTIGDSLAYVGTGQGLYNSRRVSYGDFYIF